MPGEPPKQPDVHTFGMVNAIFVAPDEKIWRYMPLEQLFALLSHQDPSLFTPFGHGRHR